MTELHRGTEETLATIKDLIESEDPSRINNAIGELSPAETMHAFARLGRRQQNRLLELLWPDRLSGFVSKALRIGGHALLDRLPRSEKASVVRGMKIEGQMEALRKLGEKDVLEVLKGMKPRRAQEIRSSMEFGDNTAGAMMISEYLSYSDDLTVGQVLDDMRRKGEKYSDYDIQYAYVTAISGRLVGVLRLRDLLLSPKNSSITNMMIPDPLSVKAESTMADLVDFFTEHPLMGVPVIDNDGYLVGVVRSSSVREANNRQSNQLFLKFAGIVGGEEFRTMTLAKRSSRRLSWLSINIILNIVAASVIALYQDTLEKAIVLAVFLPIISDMSGCSGNQAVAVSIRELTLGLIRPKELLHVLRKEVSIGIINGLVLGCLLGLAAFMWKGNPYLGIVVGGSLAANTLVAVAIGGLVPLLLRGIRADPALASGPLLTTITDMCGFFLVFSFATILLPRLSG